MSLQTITAVSSVANNHSSVPLDAVGGSLRAFKEILDDTARVDATAQVGEQLGNLFSSVPGRIASAFGRVASSVWANLPSLSLPGARASTVCDETPLCKTPTGSYTESCSGIKVKYVDKDDECEPSARCVLSAKCEAIYAGLAHQQSSIRFAPGEALSVENRNGTLVKISSDAAVEDAFQRIASGTGGRTNFSPSAQSLTSVMQKAFGQILEDSKPNQPLDVAIVLDTTGSMGAYLAQVQENLVKFLELLPKKTEVRVGVVEYRDSSDDFLNKVNIPLTKDLKKVQTAVQSLTVSGGGDEHEAVLDALLAAKNDLSWNPKAKRAVLLVGDAPPHPKTQDGRYDESEVVAQYQAAGTEIAVYPVVAGQR